MIRLAIASCMASLRCFTQGAQLGQACSKLESGSLLSQCHTSAICSSAPAISWINVYHQSSLKGSHRRSACLSVTASGSLMPQVLQTVHLAASTINQSKSQHSTCACALQQARGMPGCMWQTRVCALGEYRCVAYRPAGSLHAHSMLGLQRGIVCSVRLVHHPIVPREFYDQDLQSGPAPATS